MSYGGLNLTTQDVSNLMDMLDPQNAASKMAFANRPETQTVGYSLSEAQPRGVSGASGATSGGGEASTAPENPGSVRVPHHVVAATSNLPVISGSKAAMQKAHEKQAKSKPTGNAIWADDEVDTYDGSGLGGTSVDTRETPEYDTVFSQHQTAEDTFLGADFTKDGSAAMSESIIVRVKMPKTTSSRDIDIDVEPLRLRVRNKEYNLMASLPMQVIEKKGTAKWDPATRILAVTLTTDPAQRQVKII